MQHILNFSLISQYNNSSTQDFSMIPILQNGNHFISNLQNVQKQNSSVDAPIKHHFQFIEKENNSELNQNVSQMNSPLGKTRVTSLSIQRFAAISTRTINLGTIKSSYSIGKTNMLKSSQKRQIAKFQI
jgi:hypothetical protein